MTRSIVIAGVSKAIGRAEAEALVAAGWDVIGIAGEFFGSIRDY
jgi:NAD(P)-dependent dehydrogenase (short-subunit alcohol dehydrogenase family)